MQNPVTRGVCGFVAAAVSVLIFHQAMWALLHALALPGLGMPPPYPIDPIAPFGVPRILDLCFWGGLYGIVYGLVFPRLSVPAWLSGLIMGIIAALVGLLVVPAIKGLPIGAGFPLGWLKSFLINGCWGFGVGVIFPLMLSPRRRLA